MASVSTSDWSNISLYFQKADNKDSSIHKRLSWNQTPTIPGNELGLKTKQSKCLSTDSVQSSSGVSSTGSLHLSIGSEFEPSLTSQAVVTIGVPGAPAASGATPPIPPRGNHHISTTYITQDINTLKTKILTAGEKVTAGGAAGPGPGKERTYLSLEAGRKDPANPEITISQAKESGSPININISSQKNETEIIKLREILLTDSSVEAS